MCKKNPQAVGGPSARRTYLGRVESRHLDDVPALPVHVTAVRALTRTNTVRAPPSVPGLNRVTTRPLLKMTHVRSRVKGMAVPVEVLAAERLIQSIQGVGRSCGEKARSDPWLSRQCRFRPCLRGMYTTGRVSLTTCGTNSSTGCCAYRSSMSEGPVAGGDQTNSPRRKGRPA